MLKIGVALAQWSFGENTKNSDDGTIGMGIFVKQMEVTDGLFFFSVIQVYSRHIL